MYIDLSGNVVSSSSLIAGTPANGVTITSSAITRSATNGTMVIAAGSSTGALTLQAGGNNGLVVNDDGSLTISAAASFTGGGSVNTAFNTSGPTGSHANPQTWLTIKDTGGVTRYIPCF